MSPEQKAAIDFLVRKSLHENEFTLVEYATRLLGGDSHRAQDIVQEAFLKLCQQNPESVKDNVRGWLFTVVRNRALDSIRRERRVSHLDEKQWMDVASDLPDPSEQAGWEDHEKNVLRFLDRLPQNQKDVVLLKFQQGMSYKEIASVTGLGISNVGFLLHTALKRLRQMMEAYTSEFHC